MCRNQQSPGGGRLHAIPYSLLISRSALPPSSSPQAGGGCYLQCSSTPPTPTHLPHTCCPTHLLPAPPHPHPTHIVNSPQADGGYAFFMPRESLIGGGALVAAGERIQKLGFKKALIITDAVSLTI